MTRDKLFIKGKYLLQTWCNHNDVLVPVIKDYRKGSPTFGTCAYYRNNVIHIWVNHCAKIGTSGRRWSFPGYTTDRTPYGVLCHELGHHVDEAHGARPGKFSRHLPKEKPITSYCPNQNEKFAEIFRLFVTNPSLLAILRPLCFDFLVARFPVMIETRTWAEILNSSPRHVEATTNKIWTSLT